MSNFTYNNKQFYLDGKPFQVRSGAMHYFRIPACYWEDRLLKLKECVTPRVNPQCKLWIPDDTGVSR